MAKYIKQEMPDLRKTGKTGCYYRMQSSGNINTEKLADIICRHGGVGLSEGVVIHVLQEVADEIAIQLAEGYTVTLDGIGTFKTALGVADDKEMDTIDGTETKRNGQSLKVTGINCRVDKELVKNVDARCSLTRAGVRRVNSSPYSREERLKLLHEWLSDAVHPFIHVKEYAQLTGQPYSSACKELRDFCDDKACAITSTGRGAHKVYVGKSEE